MKRLQDASRMRQVLAGTIVSLKKGMPHRMTTNMALLIWIGLPAIFLGGTKAFLLDIHKMDRQRCNRRSSAPRMGPGVTTSSNTPGLSTSSPNSSSALASSEAL